MPRKTKAPAYFVWNDGHPRWEPGRHARQAGFSSTALKDRHGGWLKRPDAYAAAEALNERWRAFRGGEHHGAPTRSSSEAIARGADNGGSAPTLSQLCDTFRKRPKMLGGVDPERPGARRLRRSTRLAYGQHFRIIEAWAGDLDAAAIAPSDVEYFYEQLANARGPAMANAVMRSLSALYYFGGAKGLRRLEHNPVVGLEKDREQGRTVLWRDAELVAAVRCADWLARPELGDAVVIGVMTGLRPGDLLRLPEMVFQPPSGSEGQTNGVCRFRTSKTGEWVKLPHSALLGARLEAARQRNLERYGEGLNRPQIVNSRTGKGFDPEGKEFGRAFRALRAVASGLAFALAAIGPLPDKLGRYLPSCSEAIGQAKTLPFVPEPALWDKHFQDLRDTAVTWLFGAGCLKVEIATITGHSLKTIDAILERHYLVRDDAFARAAGVKQAAFVAGKNLDW